MGTDSYRFAVIGGDLRQWYLAKLLAQKGHEVTAYGLCKKEAIPGLRTVSSLEEAMQEEVIIGSIPFLKNGTVNGTDVEPERFGMLLKERQFLFAGGIPKPIYDRVEGKEVFVFDVMQALETVLKNSIAVAEGIIAEAIQRSPKNLRGSHCLVLGYGNCGRTLVSYLKGMGCSVSVYDKSREAALFAHLNAVQMSGEEELPANLRRADFIFNTVPEVILKKRELSLVKKDTWILDMASFPGGVDYKEAERHGVSAVLLPGLPGKYAPLSSAKILADTILWKLKEFVA